MPLGGYSCDVAISRSAVASTTFNHAAVVFFSIPKFIVLHEMYIMLSASLIRQARSLWSRTVRRYFADWRSPRLDLHAAADNTNTMAMYYCLLGDVVAPSSQHSHKTQT